MRLSPPPPRKFDRGECIGGVTIGSAKDRWEHDVTKGFSDLRLAITVPKRDWRGERITIIDGVSECLRIRLENAFAPILATLDRIERQVGVLASLRTEHWAHSTHPVNKRTDEDEKTERAYRRIMAALDGSSRCHRLVGPHP